MKRACWLGVVLGYAVMTHISLLFCCVRGDRILAIAWCFGEHGMLMLMWIDTPIAGPLDNWTLGLPFTSIFCSGALHWRTTFELLLQEQRASKQERKEEREKERYLTICGHSVGEPGRGFWWQE